MSLFDLIRDLRTREADPARAANAMKVMGWVCLLAGIWNFIAPSLMPLEDSPARLSPDYPVRALATSIFLGTLFFLSSRGIADRAPWGRRLGQGAVAAAAAVVLGFFAQFFLEKNAAFQAVPDVFLIIVFVLLLAQLGLPAYFGIRYLGRLTVDEYAAARPDQRSLRTAAAPRRAQGERYTDALLPIGAPGMMVVLIALPVLATMIAGRFFGPAVLPAVFIPAFLVIFLGPPLYNAVHSPFEETRSVVASYTGGGSIFLMNGTWPFFRLLVYGDGVELRVMFHRYFIPYDRMEDLPEKIGFFSSGVVFRSDLPGVPSSIRFYAFGSKGVLALVKEQRERFLAQRRAN